MDNGELQTISVKLLVKNRQVVFMESNKDFVDVLFSFITLPIGTIIKLTSETSSEGKIGCLNNLYTSVENLDEELLLSPKFRDILLHPRSAAEICCRDLKVNLNQTDGAEYYMCKSANCDLVSFYQTGQCRCGQDFVYKLILSSPTSGPQEGRGLVKPTARFMISDDFRIMPLSTMTGLFLVSQNGAGDGSPLEERTVKVGRHEVLELLKCSLVSRKPLSEIFLQESRSLIAAGHKNFREKCGQRSMDQSLRVDNSTNNVTEISLKLIVDKSSNRGLYAEVEEDFVDLLCSFLIIPLGYLFENFPCLSFEGCMDNLHKSIENIEVKLFESQEIKEELLNSKLAPGLACNNQLLNIKEATEPSYTTVTSSLKATVLDLISKDQHGEVKTSKGFIRGPSKFMVMENLTVMPLSPISGMSLIKEAKIPPSDIGEKKVIMGEDEALHLFVASLVSKNALTDAFLMKEPKEEQ